MQLWWPASTACRDARARPQVIDQPDTRGNQENDDQSRSQVLLHAAAIFFSLPMPHRISDRRVLLDRGQTQFKLENPPSVAGFGALAPKAWLSCSCVCPGLQHQESSRPHSQDTIVIAAPRALQSAFIHQQPCVAPTRPLARCAFATKGC